MKTALLSYNWNINKRWIVKFVITVFSMLYLGLREPKAKLPFYRHQVWIIRKKKNHNTKMFLTLIWFYSIYFKKSNKKSIKIGNKAMFCLTSGTMWDMGTDEEQLLCKYSYILVSSVFFLLFPPICRVDKHLITVVINFMIYGWKHSDNRNQSLACCSSLPLNMSEH